MRGLDASRETERGRDPARRALAFRKQESLEERTRGRRSSELMKFKIKY